jgi:cytoskeleton protein RodZ
MKLQSSSGDDSMSDEPFDARSPGDMLRSAREKQGLHIAALAAAIKVSPRKLDALEHDRWDELPDATFVRALAQTVCRTLKIDPVPVLALMPPAGGVTFEPGGGGLNAPFRDRPGRDEPGLSLGAIRPMVLAASVLMLAAVALVFVPDRYWAGAVFRSAAVPASAESLIAPAAPPAMAASSPAAEVPASGSALASGLFPPPDAVPTLAAVPATVAGVAMPTTAVSTPAAASILAAPTATLGTAATSPSSAALPANATGLLQVRTIGTSWVEARDGSGRVLLSRVVQAGESLGLDGSAPIRVTIGNAAVTRLDFRGQPVDLVPSTRDNVVRIELK